MSHDGKDLEATEVVNHECSTSIRDCKQEKRNAKTQMTRLFNKLASVLTEDDSSVDIKVLLEKIQEQQENTLEVMTRLENAYRQKQDETMAEKVSDEADDLVEQIDRETMPARSLLASLTKVKSRAAQSPIAKHHRDEKRKKEQKWRRVYEGIGWNGRFNRIVKVRTPRSGTSSCQRRDNQTTPGIGRRNRRRIGIRKRSYRRVSQATIATEEIDRTQSRKITGKIAKGVR